MTAEEYFDTSNDPRIVFSINVLEHAIKLIKSRKISKLRKLNMIDRLNELLKIMNQVRYMYLPKTELVKSDSFINLINKAKELYSEFMGIYRELVKDNEFIIKWLRFTLRVIVSLEHRLLNYPDKPSSAVEINFVKVLSVIKHPKANKLWVTSVTNGEEKFDVITNDSSVKSNEVLLVAFLPPKEFSGITSEGMFLGSNGITRGSDKDVGSTPLLSDAEEKKIISEIYNYLK